MLFVLCVFIFSVSYPSKTWFANGEPQVPCYFIFGDSLADPGNNNNLASFAKANYPPYGIDFPQGVATGRFSNGRTYVDIISQLLGFNDFIPRFVGNRNNILKGVNYASGASGIRDESGRTQGDRFSMNEQLSNHRTIVGRIALSLRGTKAATEYLNKCIYTVGIGSNDYINNYFMPRYYSSSRLYNPDQFATLLIQQFSRQLMALHNVGARKVALIGLGLIGFTPVEMAMHASGNPPTIFDINNAVELFNIKVKSLVEDLNDKLTDAIFTFINTSAIATPENPTPGFTNVLSPCCIIGRSNFTCEPNTSPCPDRNQYAFFDNIHTSEAVNVLFGNAYYNSSSPTFVHPYDIATLALL